jgi:5'-nucleotidase
VLVELPGSTIRRALEQGVSNLSSKKVMQHSGIKVVYDLNRQPYDRIIELKVLCQKCPIPKYEPLVDSKMYKVSLTNYIADGGDGWSMFPETITSRTEGPRDIDALADYIKKFTPLNMASQLGRTTFV